MKERTSLDRYEKLKAKWNGLADTKGGWHRVVSSPKLLAPGKFVMYMAFTDPDGPPLEFPTYLESPYDALAFIRFMVIPGYFYIGSYDRVLGFKGYYSEDSLEKFEGQPLDVLLAALEGAMKAEGIAPDVFAGIVDKYNACFANANPGGSIPAWGNVASVLKAPCLWSRAEKLPLAVRLRQSGMRRGLRGLLDSGKFDENDSRHLGLAREFFEMVRMD